MPIFTIPTNAKTITIARLEKALCPKFQILDNGCWQWTTIIKGKQYSSLYHNHKNVAGHRFFYELIVGNIPPKLGLDHLCLNKACVNPKHLEPVTDAVNKRRWAETLTHCARANHEYTPTNTYINPTGHRECRICRKENRGTVSKQCQFFVCKDTSMERQCIKRTFGTYCWNHIKREYYPDASYRCKINGHTQCKQNSCGCRCHLAWL